MDGHRIVYCKPGGSRLIRPFRIRNDNNNDFHISSSEFVQYNLLIEVLRTSQTHNSNHKAENKRKNEKEREREACTMKCGYVHSNFKIK